MKRDYLSVEKVYLKCLCVRFWNNALSAYEWLPEGSRLPTAMPLGSIAVGKRIGQLYCNVSCTDPQVSICSPK